MINYQRNNIIFRIASADAIGKFKKSQAFAFVQLARKELGFFEAAKEVVLLEFDRFSQWIFRAEKICLAGGEGLLSDQIRRTIISSFIEEMHIIESVMESHPEVFSFDVYDFTKLIHAHSVRITCVRVEEACKKNADEAFPQMVDEVANYLQHMLICMHEFNNNILKKNLTPFISISDFCVKSDTPEERCQSLLKRAKFFTERGAGDKFVLKNYTSNEDVVEGFSNFLSQFGISTIPEDVEVTT